MWGTFGEIDCSTTQLAKCYKYKTHLGIISMYHQYVIHIQSPRRNCLTVFLFQNEQCLVTYQKSSVDSTVSLARAPAQQAGLTLLVPRMSGRHGKIGNCNSLTNTSQTAIFAQLTAKTEDAARCGGSLSRSTMPTYYVYCTTLYSISILSDAMCIPGKNAKYPK